jgi:viologen exporter family transport system permease protein
MTAGSIPHRLASGRFRESAGMHLMLASLQEKLVYRFDLVVGLLRTLILILVFRYLWVALYGGQAEYAGVSLDQTITYAAMSMIISPLFPNALINEVGGRIRSGNVLFDITRPMYYGNLLLFPLIGQALATLVTSSLPMLAIAPFFVHLILPTSPLAWLAFLVSLALGFLIAYLVDYIAALAGFWITETWGIFFAKWNLIDVLGGKYLPLWIFPPVWKNIALLLPFRGMNYTPLAILGGEIGLRQAPLELGFQLLWIVLLAGLGRLIFAAAVKKLSVQGG